MNKKIQLVAGAIIASTGLYSASVYAADATGDATAEVLAPLTLTAGAVMDFGQVAAVTGATSTVVLSAAGVATSGDGAITGGTPAAGGFSVTGNDSLSYDIALPASATLTGGTGPDITVNTFTSSKPGDTSNTAGGTDTFTVGATLNLADGQGSGTYTGTYNISVDYQ